jgi:rhomboid family GlyGly-CTERM serine protease
MPNAVRPSAVFPVSLILAVLILLLSLPSAGIVRPLAPSSQLASLEYGREYGRLWLAQLDQWLSLSPTLLDRLAYIRVLLGSEWWRLLTAHFIHLNLHHALMNAAGLAMLGYYFRHDLSLRAWLGLMLLSCLTISLGLWLWQPQLIAYVGFSGVLHALLYAGLILSWKDMPRVTSIVLVLLLGRLVWEHSPAYDPNYLQGWIHAQVAPAAHFFGALTGTAWGLASLWRERRRASPVAA